MRRRAVRVDLGVSRWVLFAVTYFILQEIEALGIFDRLAYGEWVGKSGDKVTEILNAVFVGVCIALFVRGFGRIALVRTRALVGFYLVAFFLASATWSIDPSFSIRESTLYAVMMLGSIGTATTLGVDAFMKLIARACLLAAIASLTLYFVAPHTVISVEDLDFRGVFSQKNVLGQAMMVGALAYLHRLRTGHGARWGNLLALGLITLVCLMSHSATSTLTIAMMCGLDILFVLFRKRGAFRLIGIASLALGVPALIVAAAAPDALLDLIGKDRTLTGRTEIWDFVMRMIADRPILGWGYLAFWTPSNPFAVELSNIVHWFVPQAHNGLLEIALHLGLVGAVAFISLWAHTLVLAIRCVRIGQWSLGATTILTCIAAVQIGISELVLVAPFQALTPVFFTLALMCERALREQVAFSGQHAWLESSRPGSASAYPANH